MKFNFKKTLAFTLAELMMFLVIISVLLSIIFAITKPKKVLDEKNIKYKYAAVYDALNAASYDYIMEYDADTTKNPFSTDDPKEGFVRMCNGLTKYLNAMRYQCHQPITSEDTYFLRDEDLDFRKVTENIAANNGMEIYISPLIIDDIPDSAKESRSYYNAENPDFRLKFFMVYVDINGAERPNAVHSVAYDPENKKIPSVFAFAILPTGDAIPIGVAEDNVKYFATRISYYNKDEKAIFYSPFYSLRYAKHAAWNWYKTDKDFKFKEKISFTYSDYVKEILLRHNSKLYNYTKTKDFPETFTDEYLYEACKPSGLLTYYDLCSISVDTPMYGATN